MSANNPGAPATDPSGADLELATRVEAHGDGAYAARLSRDWEIWGPNGGYLAAIALRAAGLSAQIQRPASLYCHFLSPPAFAGVQLEVNVLRRGRRAESFAVAMSQQGKPVLHALVKTAASAPGYSHQYPQAPAVPAPDTLASYDELLPPERLPPFRFWDNIERRPIDQSVDERPTPTEPVVREWTRYRPTACFGDPFVDAARALILLDTYGFPAAYRKYRSWEYLAPNLDTSVWFHNHAPECAWLLIDHECSVASGGLMGVSGRVWDLDGRLLATGSAQLCCVPNSD